MFLICGKLLSMNLNEVIGHESIKKMLPLWKKKPAFAYLFSGPAHIGKTLLAEKFVRGLADLDEIRSLETHPDVIVLLPEEGKKEIGVKIVREARARLYERPQIANRMIVYLPRIDWLNQEGFNTLLKVMEDPPSDTVFIGIAEQLSTIPITIFSRMVHISMGLVAEDLIFSALIAKGKDAISAKKLARGARGKPGLAMMEKDVLIPYRQGAIDFVNAKSLGVRLEAIDELRRIVEEQEDSREGWSDALNACMEEVRNLMATETDKSIILGQGIIDALNALNGSISPRIMLEGSAIQVSRNKNLILPTGLPNAYPSSLVIS